MSSRALGQVVIRTDVPRQLVSAVELHRHTSGEPTP